MVKLIVLDKIINSLTEFKQIIGRGTRLVWDKDKRFFTIMDFRRATEQFSDPEFDGPATSTYTGDGTKPIPAGDAEDPELDDDSNPSDDPDPDKKFRVNDVSAKIKKQIRAKNNALKKLIRKDLDKISIETLAANPSIKFITDEFMLLSAQSSLATDRYGEDVTFGKAWPIDIRDEGIELSLPFFKRIVFNTRTNTWYCSKDENPELAIDEYIF